jgi:hypothetical protein
LFQEFVAIQLQRLKQNKMKKFCENCGRTLDGKATCENCITELDARYQTNKSETKEDSQSEISEKLEQFKIRLLNSIMLEKRCQDLLTFSNAVLWPDETFSEEKKMSLLPLITEHFRDSNNINQTFRELVERTVMAKRWVDEKEYRTLLSPAFWFNINRIDGLYSTHSLYGKMLTQKKTIPSYQFGLTVISEAVLRFCQHQNILHINGYRDQFIKLNRMDLLQYYFSAVMHIQFVNH